MNVLVTGGAGFIGGSVVRKLIARGDRVVAIVRDPDRTPELHALGVEVRRGDLTRIPAIVDAMRGCDGVIHLAGDYRVGHPGQPAAGHAGGQPGLDQPGPGGGRHVGHRAPGLRLDRQRLRRHPRPHRRRALSARPGRRLPELLRRDQVPGPSRRRGAHRDRPAGGHHDARHQLRPGRSLGPRRPARAGLPGHRAVRGHGRCRDERRVRRGHRGGPHRRARSRTDRRVVHPGRREPAAARRDGRRRPGRWPSPAAPRDPQRAGPPGLARTRPSWPGPSATRTTCARSPRAIGVTFWASSAKAATELGYRPRDLASGARAAFGND